MFHETLEKQDAKLYEYLLEDDIDDGISSLPGLESSTAASFLMEDDSQKSFTTTSDNMSRDRFGWTTPILARSGPSKVISMPRIYTSSHSVQISIRTSNQQKNSTTGRHKRIPSISYTTTRLV
jgi:hypothetical protein